jgi:hypothetical protein
MGGGWIRWVDEWADERWALGVGGNWREETGRFSEGERTQTVQTARASDCPDAKSPASFNDLN